MGECNGAFHEARAQPSDRHIRALMLVMPLIIGDISTSCCGYLPMKLEVSGCHCPIQV